MSRPVPNPGILDIAPYTPGKSPVPEPGRKVFKLSANETPFGPSPKAMAVYKEAAAHLEDYPEGTSRVLREAIGRAFGLDPDRIICGAGSDEILNLLAHVYLSHGDEAISTTHGFLVYPIATKANGAVNVVAPETNFTADVDAILETGLAAHQAGVARQPEQPDRDLSAVRRGQAAARRSAAACAAGARCRLFRLRVAQRLRDRHRTGGDHRKHRDDPYVFQDSRPRGAADRLDVRAGPYRRCGESDPRTRSTSRRRRCWRRWRRSRTPRISRCRRRTPRSGATG
jgi:hypothetical protein